MSSHLRVREPKITLAIGLAGLIGLMVIALLVAGVAWPLTLLLILVLSVQIVGGGLLWALLRNGQRVSPIELIGVGFVIGSLLSLMSSQLLLNTRLSGVAWAVPSLLILLILALLRKRTHFAELSPLRVREVVAVSVSVGTGFLLLLPSILSVRLSDGFPLGRYSGDLVFFENLSQGISRFGPADNILLADEAVRYHWFTYAWQGALSNAVAAEPFLVLTRVLPLVLLLAVAFLAVAWAANLSSVSWVPALAGLLVSVGGFVGAQQGVIINFDSPSSAYASALLLAFAIGLVPLLHMPLTLFAPTLLVLSAIAGSSVGSKASHAGVLAGGLLLLSIAAFRYERSVRIRVWLLTLASGVAMAGVYWWTLFGLVPGTNQLSFGDAGIRASTFQGLDPFPTTLGAWLGTAVLILAILPRWAGLGWLVWNTATRYAPTTVLGVGMALSGISAVLFTSSGGTNEVWFALAATSVIGVLSAVGIGSALRSVTFGELVPAIIFAVLTTMALIATYVIAVTSEASVLWRGPVLAWIFASAFGGLITWYRKAHNASATNWLAWTTVILLFVGIGARASGTSLWQFLAPRFESTTSKDSMHPGQGEVFLVSNTLTTESVMPLDADEMNTRIQPAAQWLLVNAKPTDIVSTTTPYAEAVLSASTGLRMYVAGIPYVNGYTNQRGFDAFERRMANIEQLISQPSEAIAESLRGEQVRYVWVDTLVTKPDAIAQLGQIVFADDAVTIVDITESSSNSS